MNKDKDNKNEWANREIGALWKKESSTQKYLSGHLKIDGLGGEEVIQVIIFGNKNKKKDNHPDFRVYKSVPKKQEVAAVGVVSKKSAELASGVKEVTESVEDDVL